MRQKDKLFIDLFDKVRVGYIDHDVEKLLEARFIQESDENYLKDDLHMYAENELATKRNKAVLNDFPGGLYIIQTNDKIPGSWKDPLA